MYILSEKRSGAFVGRRVGDAHLAEMLLDLPRGNGDVLLTGRDFPWLVGIVAVAHLQDGTALVRG